MAAALHNRYLLGNHLRLSKKSVLAYRREARKVKEWLSTTLVIPYKSTGYENVPS
jgi:hypothetical protein